MLFNANNENDYTYDAIVVGSGISGGWAAKEFCEKGMKTLVLERGKPLNHGDYKTEWDNPWDVPNRGYEDMEAKKRQYRQSQCGPYHEEAAHHFIDDVDAPYTNPEDKPTLWIRASHVGGRSVIWGRQSYRWSPMDFEANAKDGIAIPWPIGYEDVKPWYEYVEKFAGISGSKENLPHLPDSDFLPAMDLNCVEKEIKAKIEKQFKGRKMIIGRTAHLTQPHNGRGQCQSRNRCMRGCSYGAYFSSLAATLPVAASTGNLTLRPNSLVERIVYDKDTGLATGVNVIDTETMETREYKAKVVFLCASALGSTQILLQSRDQRFTNGIGGSSDVLGRNLMDHHFKVGAFGAYDGPQDMIYNGNRPNGIYIPRFQNLNGQDKDFIRGYGYQGGARRQSWQRGFNNSEFGAAFKEQMTRFGDWAMGIMAFGEILPYADNRVTLNEEVRDKWGLPVLHIEAELKENEKKMRKDMQQEAIAMLEAAGCTEVGGYEDSYAMAEGIHEMGTARMGDDPNESVLNKWNQVHEMKNVYVTDGACMTSAACQNPSLTYMALTARAVDHAYKTLNKGGF